MFPNFITAAFRVAIKHRLCLMNARYVVQSQLGGQGGFLFLGENKNWVAHLPRMTGRASDLNSLAPAKPLPTPQMWGTALMKFFFFSHSYYKNCEHFYVSLKILCGNMQKKFVLNKEINLNLILILKQRNKKTGAKIKMR